MAAPKRPNDDLIIAASKALAEARRSFERDDAIRQATKKLLKPGDVAGDYDVSRSLETMLGGSKRPITIDDLKHFKRETDRVKQERKVGITAKGVIDLSLPIDRERASKEIRTAVPISAAGGVIKFMTNSGPESDRDRHYVTVDVRNFGAVAASAIKVERCGHELVKSPLGISCTCGRWRYWLAFVATAGGYNSGHREDGFPKVRNPGLVGVACKHVLRVMAVFSQSPQLKLYLSNLVQRAREQVQDKRRDEKVSDSREMAERMRKDSWRQRQIQTSDEKRQARASKAQRAALATAATQAPKPEKAAPSSRKAAQNFSKLAAQYGLSPEQTAALLAVIKP